MRKRNLVPLFILMSVFSACTLKSLREADESGEGDLTEVTVIQLQKEELFDYLSFSGNLVAQSQLSLYAPLAGQIKELAVKEGSKVKKGDKLLVIKPDSEGNEYRDHVMRAPRAGVVLGGMFAKGGIHTDKNQELLVLADLSSFKIEVSATIEDLKYLKKDQKVDVQLSAYNKDLKVEGLIRSIPRAPDAKTKTFTILVEIPCSEKETCKGVFPGLIARVLVKKEPHMGFKCPFKYLRRQKSHLLVVNDDNTAHFLEVKVGQHYGEDVEILEGITSETRIVTHYSSTPQEGEKVKISPRL